MKYVVWIEGYAMNSERGTAHLLGEVEAANFTDACIKLCKNDTDFNKEHLTVWGCRLFDNEIDAREAFC